MKLEKALAVLEPFLRHEEEAGITVIRLTDDVLRVGEEVENIEAFRCFLDHLSRSPEKAVLCITTRQCFSPERCDQLWQRVGSLSGQRLKSNWFPDPMTKVALDREESVFGQLIGWLRRVPKPVIMTFRGEVAFPFLGAGLACEYRLAAGDTVFFNRCHELGLPPGLGLLYMLPAYVGFGKAAARTNRTSARKRQVHNKDRAPHGPSLAQAEARPEKGETIMYDVPGNLGETIMYDVPGNMSGNTGNMPETGNLPGNPGNVAR